MSRSETNGAHRGFGRLLWINAPVVFCLLAIVAVGVGLYNYSLQYYQQAKAQAVLQAEETIRRVVLDVTQVFYAYDSILKASIALLGDEAIEALPEDKKNQLVSRVLAEFPYVHALLFLDANGDVRISSGRETAPGAGYASTDFFRVQVSGALVGPYLTVTRAEKAANPEVAISRRMTYDGQFKGVAVAFIRLSDFRDQFTNIHIGEGNTLALAHEGGRILTRRPAQDGKGDFGVRLSAEERARVSLNAGTYVAASAVDGRERLFVFQHVPDWPLDLIFGVPVEVIDGAWRQRMTLAGGGSALVCAGLLLLGFRLRRERIRRVEAEAVLEQMSVTDFLTGLPNRRRFDEVLQREFRRAERTYAWMSVVIIDADHFKALNDRYGHAAGDETLKLISHIITQNVRRAGDFAARLGGEEFALILPDTPAAAAFEIMERIRLAMEHSVGLEQGPPSTTLSAGIASTHDRPRPENCKILFERADQALYRAKRAGRNRTELAAALQAVPEGKAESASALL